MVKASDRVTGGMAHIGSSRAEVSAKWLCEMNPEVKGQADTRNAASVIEKEPSFFDNFTIVITSQVQLGPQRLHAGFPRYSRHLTPPVRESHMQLV